jgi:hypothetical protein
MQRVIGMIPITRLVLLVGVAYLGYALLLVLFQRSLLFPGRWLTPPAMPSGVAAAAETVWLTTSFGMVESRLVLPNHAGGPFPLVIIFHGNGELIDSPHPAFEQLQQLGCALLLVEYPGYGRSAGRPRQQTIIETALAAFDVVRVRPVIDRTRIVSFGTSIGAYPATVLAVQRPVQALILAAPFSSLRPFAHRRLLPAWLLFDSFDTLAAIPQYAGRTLVLHGQHDTIVPFEHGQQVAAAAVQGQLVPLPADHNDLLDQSRFWDEVRTFLSATGSLQKKT